MDKKMFRKIISFVLIAVLSSNIFFADNNWVRMKAYAAETVKEEGGHVIIQKDNYTLDIELEGFRYGFYKPDGTVIADKNQESGICFGLAGGTPGKVVSSTYLGVTGGIAQFKVVNENNLTAAVNIQLFDRYVRFEIIPEKSESDPGEVTTNLPKILWADAQANWPNNNSTNTALLSKAGTDSMNSTIRMLDIATDNQYVMEADVKIPAGGTRSIGLFMNYQGPKEIDCFFIKAGSSGNIGFKNISDTKGTTDLAPAASYTINTEQWYALKIIVNGRNIKCYLNEALIYDVNKSANCSGPCGIRVDKMNASIDNIRVYDNTYVYYENDFENTTIDKVGSEFQAVLGTAAADLITYTPSIIDREGMLKLNANPQAQALVGTIDQTVNRVSADISFASGDEETSGSLIFGYQDDNNYYGFGFAQAQIDTVILYQVSNGVKTVLGTAPFPYSFLTKYSLGVAFLGGKLDATVNGSNVISIDKEPVTGQIGVNGTVTTLYADNVSVETAGGNTTYTFTNADVTGWTMTPGLASPVYGSDGIIPEPGSSEGNTTDKYVIDARVAGIDPLYGLGDYGAYDNSGGVRSTTNVSKTDRTTAGSFTNLSDGKRFISNFTIAPNRGFGQVLFEEGEKRVSFHENQTMLGVLSAEKVTKLYYFFGSNEEIYQDYRDVRNMEGYEDTKPHYEAFGLGWEAFGALGWNAYQSSVENTVQEYLDAGYDLTWAVVGSGFWPGDRNGLEGTTTSFGMWDNVPSSGTRADGLPNPRFPDPDSMKNFFKSNNIKLLLGIRDHFKLPAEYGGKWDPSVDGTLVQDGLANGYFIKNEDGSLFTVAKAKYPTGNITRGNVSLVDGDNPAAVEWYANCAKLWGVDGFKEDAMISQSTFHDGNWNRLLSYMIDRDNDLMIMRNGAYALSGDILRINDANYGTSNSSFNNSPDRMPINLLSYAASGVSNVYPDIIGGTGGNINDANYQKYVVRNATFDALTPSVSVGINVLNMDNELYKNAAFKAINWHSTYAPYIYDAALKSWQTGYPTSMTPLYIAYPNDSNTYEMASMDRRQYEWLLGESILATPLFGTDFLTTDTRDVYLPEGKWLDYETGDVFMGPMTIEDKEMPVDQMPVYIGGKGILVGEDMQNKDNYFVDVFPVAEKGTTYNYTWVDGQTTSTITNNADGWTMATLKVMDATTKKEVSYTYNETNHSIHFPYEAGHNYEVIGGEGNGSVAIASLTADKTTVSAKQAIKLTLDVKNDKMETIPEESLSITYVSSNPDVIKIDSSGKVTIGKNGTATIYAKVVRTIDKDKYPPVKTKEITIVVADPSVNYVAPICNFQDDFESGNLESWKDLVSDYVVKEDGSGNQVLYYKNTTASARGNMLIGDNTWTDYTLETDITLDNVIAGKTVGLTARYADFASCYILGYTAGTGIRYIKRNISTGSVEQKNVPFTMNQGQTYHYKMEVKGDTLTLWIDGTEIISVKDVAAVDPVISSGPCGLYSNGMTAIFDNVTVKNDISVLPFNLKGTAVAAEQISLEILAEDGKTLESKDEIKVNADGSWSYPVYHLPQGIHICHVSVKDEKNQVLCEDSETIRITGQGIIPDFTELDAIIKKAKDIDTSNYSTETVKAFQTILNYAESLSMKQASQAIVDEVMQKLVAAMNALSTDNNPPTNPPGNNPPGNNSNNPDSNPPGEAGTTPEVGDPKDTKVTIRTDGTGQSIAVVSPRTGIKVQSGKIVVSQNVDSSVVINAAKKIGATKEKPLLLKIEIKNDDILKQIQQQKTPLQVSVVIPKVVTESDLVEVESLVLNKEILDYSRKYGKGISVSIKSGDGKTVKWTVSATELKKKTNKFKDINLLVTVTPSKNLKGMVGSKGLAVKMSQTGKLGVTCKVSIYVKGQQGIKAGKMVYLYRYDVKSKKLVSLKEKKAKVNADGYVSLNLAAGADYVILPKAGKVK